MTDTILREALERFEESAAATATDRTEAAEDIRFTWLGEQWPREIESMRKAESRPCLTINRMPSFIRRVVNEGRQSKPGVIIRPVDSQADLAAAKVIQGLVRSIERRSDAEVAYDTALLHAVSGGFGFFRVSIDYVHEDSFDLECKIDRIPNPLQVHWDVASTAYDASDWAYGFVSEWLSVEEFRSKYGKKAATVDFGTDTRGDMSRWLQTDLVRVAEYWERIERSRTIYLLDNGATIRADVVPDALRQQMEAGGLDPAGIPDGDMLAGYLAINGLSVVREREARHHEVKRRVLSGVEVLSEEDWPGSMIPICPVWGEEVWVDDRRYFRSMIRDAKDPQRMLNFWRTASTELVALAPKAPWLIEENAIPKGWEESWATANSRAHAYLMYSRGSQRPDRQPFAGIPAGALQEALNASDDIKSVVGIYDSSLGARSNETSGRAILARQRESDVSNFHFLDNLAHGIAYCGRLLVELIPAVYGARQTIRILGDDEKDEVVTLTQQDGGAVSEDGEQKLYNLNVGRYDVVVSSGPSFATQREESREFMLELMRQVPGAAQVIGDIVLEMFDFEGADRIAERLRALQQVNQAGMQNDR